MQQAVAHEFRLLCCMALRLCVRRLVRFHFWHESLLEYFCLLNRTALKVLLQPPRGLHLLSADRTRVAMDGGAAGITKRPSPALGTSVQRRRDMVLLTRSQSAVPAQGSASWPQQCRHSNYRPPLSYYQSPSDSTQAFLSWCS